MRCWFWHDWSKWGKVAVVGVKRSDETVFIQCRTCKRCGKWQRKARFDG